MKRIGIVCGGGTVSGKEIMVMELADGFRERGYQVELVTSHWGRPEFAERFIKLGFPVHKVWFGFISISLRLNCIYMTSMQMLRWPQLLWGFRRFIRTARPEKIVHTNWHSLLTLLPLLKADRDVFWVHEVMPNKPQYRQVFGWLARRLGCFICVSNAAAQGLRDIGISSDKIHIIHNGITSPVGAGGSSGVPSSGRTRIGIIGQIGRWKGHEDLFEAFCSLSKDFPASELHIYGRSQDDFEKELKCKVASSDVSDRVVWHGFVSERSKIFQSIDICVVPSRCIESFGMVAAEAGFFGVPVIVSRRGGLAEIVKEGVTGYIFEAGKVDELVICLRRLLKDEQLRRTMGEKARQHVEVNFGRERLVSDFVQVINRTIK